jgi:sugar O-acyltransferase (sialic acid O-acetyltransferase NeuD family)
MGDTQYNNKKDVVILGAGSLGREILSWIESSKVESDLSIVGFLDDNKKDLLDYSISIPVLGLVDSYSLKKNPSFIIGMLNSEVRENLFNKSREYGITAVTYLHETVLIGSRSKFGEGLVMLPNSLISCDVTIGNHVFINNGSQIGHDVTVGDFTCIMANVDIGGGAQIGNKVFIGSKAVILPGVKIPDNTRVGAGTVVIRSIKQAGTYFGNPAKKIF